MKHPTIWLLVVALILGLTSVFIEGTNVLESKIVLGGLFSQVNSTDYNNVVMYDLISKQLFNMENGTDGEVHIVHTDTNGNVYIGGVFNWAGSADCGPIAIWKKGSMVWESVNGLTSADFTVGSM